MRLGLFGSTQLCVAGLVLLFTHGWFSQQHTVGWVLLVCGAGPLTLVLLGFALFLSVAAIGDYRDTRRRRKRAFRRGL